MKKCFLMFGMFVIAMLFTLITDVKADSKLEEKFLVEKDIRAVKSVNIMQIDSVRY